MSDLNDKKIKNNKEKDVNGGSHWHPGIEHQNRAHNPAIDDGQDRNFPKVVACMDCGTEFTIATLYDYDYQSNNYNGLYCSNCRNKHKIK